MSHFDEETLRNLEKLSMIRLTKTEEKEFVKSLKQIVDYVEKLFEVDTENVMPCHYVLMNMQKNVFREDIEEKVLSRDKFLENAPDKVAGMIKVPSVITLNDKG